MGGILSLPCFRRRTRRRAAPPTTPSRSISHPRPLVRRQGSRTSAATTRSVRPRRRQLIPTVDERHQSLIRTAQGTETETEGMDMDIDKDVSMQLGEKGERDLDTVERDLNFDMDEPELRPQDLGVEPAMPGETDTELLSTDTAPPSVLALPLLPSLPSLPSFPSLALSLPSCPSSTSLSHMPLDLPTDSDSLPHDSVDVDIPRPTSTPSLRIARSPTRPRTRTRSQSLHRALPGPSVARRRLSHTSHLSLTHRASSSTLHTRRSVHFSDPVVDEGSDDTHCSAATRGTVLTHKTHGTSATTDTMDTMGTNASMESAALLGPHSTDTSLSTLDTSTTVRTPTSSLNNLHAALFPRHVSRASARRLRKTRRIDGWEFIGRSELAGWSDSVHAGHSL